MPDSEPKQANTSKDGRLWARWIFLRALGLIFFSAFYSLAFQIHGLIGERGILPADYYLHGVASQLGPIERTWYAPTLLWINASDLALTLLVVAGPVAPLPLVFYFLPN